MRKARFVYAVEVEIDEDAPGWEDSDLDLFAIAQSLEIKPKHPDSVEARAVRIEVQRNLVSHYLPDEEESSK